MCLSQRPSSAHPARKMVSDHDLSDVPIQECVLDGARDLLTSAAGEELPAFVANLGLEPREAEGDDEPNVVIEYCDDRCYNERPDTTSIPGASLVTARDVVGRFVVRESVIKGIAACRAEDVQAFLDAFLPDYRAGSISVELQNEFHTFEIEDSWSRPDTRMISCREIHDVMPGFGTEPWFISDVHAEASSKELFLLEVIFRDSQYHLPEENADAEWDQLTLSMPLSWAEYQRAMSGKEELIALLRRIHEAFLVMRPHLKGSYSDEVEEELRRREYAEDEDEDRDEDPFTSGLLALDSDGRVHFADDLRRD